MYTTANEYYRQKYGSKVYKLSLDGGFSCPNRDGSAGVGGCIFCSGAGSGEFAEKGGDIRAQLQRAKARVAAKTKDGRYVAYFQAFTSTYAPTERLRELFEAAIEPDYIVGLSVGTRPDCLPPETVQLLGRLNRIKPVTVELGLQTSDDEVARYINRGYPSVVYRDAVARLKEAGCEVVTHIIIGLPRDDARETTRFAIDCGTDGVKFHLLHVLRNTRLEQEYLASRVRALSMEEYAERLKSCIDLLPPHVVVHRITGDGAKRDLIAPMWSADKKRVLNYLNNYLQE